MSTLIPQALPDQCRSSFAFYTAYEEQNSNRSTLLNIPRLLGNISYHELGHAVSQTSFIDSYANRNYVVIQKVREFGFYYDDVERLINESDKEITALNLLFYETGEACFEFRPMHATYAEDRGFLILAREINKCLSAKAEMEDELYYEKVYESCKKVEKREDPVTSILKNRFYDEEGVLKKIKRIGREKFNIHHAMFARKQDLPLVESFIRKSLL